MDVLTIWRHKTVGNALYNSRRDAGLCVQCAQPANGKSKCAACAEKDKLCRKQRIKRRKLAGQCQNSGCHNDAMPGATVCSACSEKAGQAKLKSYYKNKEQGVCRYCGKDSDGRARCKTCAEAFADYSAQWYKNRRDSGCCANCNEPFLGETVLCEKCREKKNLVAKDRWAKLKRDALEAYGGVVCSGCPEDDIDILEIDHIDGGGTQHRKEIGLGNMYLWLKQNYYPPGYRVLCPTCNKKAHRGIPLPNEKKSR